MKLGRATFLSLLVLAGVFLADAATSFAEAAPGETSGSENAAFSYWRAIAGTREARSETDLDILRFIEQDLPLLPPQAFMIRPEAGRWLFAETALLAALEESAARKECRFDLYAKGRLAPNLSHLPGLNRVVSRTLALAKAMDYADNTEGAADLYTRLFTLVRHLDQDGNLRSGLAAAGMLQGVFSDLEGFYARNPSAKSLGILSGTFERHPDPFLHLGRYLRTEARRYASWLAEDPAKLENRLGQLYGNRKDRPALDILLSRPAGRRADLARKWIEGYIEYADEVADATDKPYLLGSAILDQLHQEAEEMVGLPPDQEANPLVPLMAVPMRRTYERFLLAEAQYAIARILCDATQYRNLVGEWPGSLSTLEKFQNVRYPPDPFSGKAFHYRSRKGPRVIARVPKWMAKSNSLLFRMDIAARQAKDNRLLQSALRQHREEQARAAKALLEKAKKDKKKK